MNTPTHIGVVGTLTLQKQSLVLMNWTFTLTFLVLSIHEHGGSGFMTYTASSHQGVIETFGLTCTVYGAAQLLVLARNCIASYSFLRLSRHSFGCRIFPPQGMPQGTSRDVIASSPYCIIWKFAIICSLRTDFSNPDKGQTHPVPGDNYDKALRQLWSISKSAIQNVCKGHHWSGKGAVSA